MFSEYKNWHVALFDRFNILSKQPLVYRLRSGFDLLVYAGTYDVQVINEIWIDEIYTPWKNDVNNNWVIVDLGGHCGIFTVYAARLVNHVYVVEANPEATSFLKVNLTINKLTDKVSLLQGAIACNEGTADFYIAADAGMSSLVKRKLVGIKKIIKTPKIPISEMIRDIPIVNLLKIDIEGGEFKLFTKECAEKWITKVERIAMEYHGNPADLYATLKYHNFRTILWPERNMLYAEHPSIWEREIK